MATTTTSPPMASSPSPQPRPPTLQPLITNTNLPRRANSNQRPQSFASKRMSTYSTTSKKSNAPESRPSSHVFPIFHSSLTYTLVRDFAYPANHPLHYGPPPHDSSLSTPVSEQRRLSDPTVSSWEDARGNWSASPPWMTETDSTFNQREQLPAMAFTDGGPPYSEDEDLQSPIVTTSKHKKKNSMSAYERGRSPGAAGSYSATMVTSNSGSDSRGYAYEFLNGPGGAIFEESQNQSRNPRQPLHRDSNFAKPLQRDRRTTDLPEFFSEDEQSNPDDDSDDARFSKDYSFTIASPDEEMHGKAVALFDFTSEHQNELPLKEGQIILVSYRHGQGWLVAEDPRSGESGLVPEEFVRLVRDIEGGLNGLESVDLDAVEDVDALSPTSIDPGLDTTPRPSSHEFPRNAGSANGNTPNDRHPPVQSTFSTSSKDLDPYPLPRRSDDVNAGSPNGREYLSKERHE